MRLPGQGQCCGEPGGANESAIDVGPRGLDDGGGPPDPTRDHGTQAGPAVAGGFDPTVVDFVNTRGLIDKAASIGTAEIF